MNSTASRGSSSSWESSSREDSRRDAQGGSSRASAGRSRDSRADSRHDTSRSLLEGLRAQDPPSWERLVRLYTPLVWFWCRRHPAHRSGLLGQEDLGDVVQEVFQTVSQRLENFRRSGPADSFRAWLHTVTRNKLTDRARQLSREPRGRGGSSMQRCLSDAAAPQDADASIEPSASGPGEEALAERRLLQRAIDAIRDQFQPRSWQAFWRTTVDGRSAAEVAAELGLSPGAVRVAKWRVLHRLRRELGEED